MNEKKQANKKIDTDIAIIGISLRFPRVKTLSEFEYILENGIDCTGKIPWNRKEDIEYIQNSDKISKYPNGAYLDDIDKFDYSFFNYSPAEAKLIDPGQRIFLETVCNTIEDAGYSLKEFDGSNTGIFVGYSIETEYKKLVKEISSENISMSIPGNIAAVIAGRISYILNLKGPSLLINTACSSSLVSVHYACKSIINGECKTAVAGGVRLNVFPSAEEKLGIEAEDGITRTFDNNTNGMGGGEGVGAILLKPLKKALQDGDHIYAVIKGSSCNHDGKTIGLSAPSASAQTECILKAWEEAEINPEKISYLEAHGTGTRLGDCIEIQGIQKVFEKFTDKKQFCAIGSVKTNIGHLDASSGFAGLAKCILTLKNRKIYPHIHFSHPNHQISFIDSPVYVNTELKELTSEEKIYCGVSSFGFSGTNCHLVLEEAPVQKSTKAISKKRLVLLSAKTKSNLLQLVKNYYDFNYNVNLDNLCYTANTGRDHYYYRIAIIFSSVHDLKSKLKKIIKDNFNNNSNSDIYFNIYDKQNEISMVDNTNSDFDIKSFTLKELAKLYCNGTNINWKKLYEGQNRNKVSIPHYPFSPCRCWVEKETKPVDLYQTKWIQKEDSLCEKTLSHKKILIIHDKSKIASTIIDKLCKEGKEIIEVIQSDKYEQLNDKLFHVGSKEIDFKKIIKQLESFSFTQVLFLYFPNVNPNESNNSLLDFRLLYDMFLFVKAMSNNSLNTIELAVICKNVNIISNTEPFSRPNISSAFSFAKTINLENPNISCRCIDIDEKTDINIVLKELNYNTKEHIYAYRNNKKHIQELDKIDEKDINQNNIQIKENGIYIIAGGAGGLGLEIAQNIANKTPVRIIFLNRSSLPKRSEWKNTILRNDNYEITHRIKGLIKLEEMGSSAEYIQTDITNIDSLQKAFSYVKEKHGTIDGIIHSAGVGVGMEGKRIRETKINEFKEIMKCKTIGTWNLKKASQPYSLDFFILFSSPITITGGIGSGSYVAANEYQEAFAAYNRHYTRSNSISISWAPWDYTFYKTNTCFNPEKNLFEKLSTQQITETFEHILNLNIGQVVVGNLNSASKLFGMKDMWEFSLSESIIKNMEPVQTESIKTEDKIKSKNNIKLNSNSPNIQTEKKLADIFGNMLGYEELNSSDNFFELGGDSIIAIKLIENINTEFGINMKVNELLRMPVLNNLAKHIDENYSNNKSLVKKEEFNNEITDTEYFKASSPQKRLYLLAQHNKDYSNWNISYIMNIKGKLDIEKLTEAFKTLITRHESLRTSFHMVKGSIVQKIHKTAEFNMDIFDYEGDINQLSKEFVQPYNLEELPLFRVKIAKKDTETYFLFNIHHIISDEISMDIIMKELVQLYSGRKLKPAKQYKEFSEWQNQQIDKDMFLVHEKYWMDILNGNPQPVKIPKDYSNKKTIYNASIIKFSLNKDITKKIKVLANKNSMTDYWVLLTILSLLLNKYISQEDILLGLPLFGRPNSEMYSALGMFTNVSPFRIKFTKDKPFNEFLEYVKNYMISLYEHQDYPFDNLIEKLNASTENLFNIYFQMHKHTINDVIFDEDLKFIPIDYSKRTVEQDLLIECFEERNKIYFNMFYNKNLFNSNTINQIKKGFINIASQIVMNDNLPISKIKLNDLNTIKEKISIFNN